MCSEVTIITIGYDRLSAQVKNTVTVVYNKAQVQITTRTLVKEKLKLKVKEKERLREDMTNKEKDVTSSMVDIKGCMKAAK